MDYNLTNSLWNATDFHKSYHLFYYSFIYRIVGTLSLSFILSVGLIGNGLVILVVVLSPALRTPTNCYLVSLSASDLIVLLSTTTLTLKEFYLPIGQWDMGQLLCQIAVCIQYLAAAVSALCICAFSIERWVAICYPIRAHSICTVRRAVRIISGIWIFASLYNLPWLFMTSTVRVNSTANRSYEKCTFRFEHTAYQAVYTADFILFYVVPLLVTSVMYTQICWFLFRTKGDHLAPVSGMSRSILNNECTRSGALAAGPLSQQHVQMCHLLNRARARKQVVKILMAIVFLFGACWFPYRLLVVYNRYARHEIRDLWFRLFARLMGYLNSAVNPILYNVMSRKFRRVLKRILRRGRFLLASN
ncbi:Thyrotropin releasing hormone receptor [Fasciolopsis buskii]|uniref:Thyrotropin-releasing hormone receptor n=1 Tax=Fasciolopsis buskii TaxID=27845 RepID=A0A8E0S1K3_9TREM|nr:Thyrotropin releasing hormone receptor [Fasciolopsis buski]